MRKLLLFIMLAAVVLLGGCNLNFLSKAADQSNNSSSDYSYSWNSDSTILSCSDGSGNLVWYEVDAPSSTQPASITRCLANGTVLFYQLFQYDSKGNTSAVAYFDASKILQSLTLNSYKSLTLSGSTVYQPLESAVFDVNGTLCSADYSTYDSTYGNKLTDVYTDNSSNLISWAVVNTYSSGVLSHTKTYDSTQRMQSDTTYQVVPAAGTNPVPVRAEYYTGAVAAKSLNARALKGAALQSRPGSKSIAASSSRASRGLTIPTNLPNFPTSLPALPTAPVFTPDNTNPVLDSYSVWEYDSHGNFQTSLRGADNFPTEVVRNDDRFDTVTIDAAWDSSERLIRKTTTYGDTKVLEVDIDYLNNHQLATGGWMVKDFQLSGASLYIPLEITVSYNGSNLPDTISALTANGKTKLYSLKYTYNDLAAPASLKSAIDLGILHFGGTIATVENFDGQDRFIGAYVFDHSAGAASLTINAYKDNGDYLFNPATDEVNATYNGKFTIGYNAAGQALSFTSYNSKGGAVWQYSYDYQDVQTGVSAMIGELGLTQADTTSASTTLTQFLSGLDTNSILLGFLKQ